MLDNICQIEIKVTDLRRSKEFYEHVFGLKLAPAEIHNYYILEVSKKSPFGISLLPQKKVEPNHSVILYFRIDSLDGIKEKLSSLESGSFRGERLVPGYGRAFFVEDPDGHRFALFAAHT